MGVYIKGMEMPKEGTCNNCPLKHYIKETDTWFCHAKYIEDEGVLVYSTLTAVDGYGNEIRPNDCPLVEIPVPHGRLVDADDVESRMIPLSFSVQKWISEVELSNCRTVIEGSEE